MRRSVFTMLVEWRVEAAQGMPTSNESQSTPVSRVSQASGIRRPCSSCKHAKDQLNPNCCSGFGTGSTSTAAGMLNMVPRTSYVLLVESHPSIERIFVHMDGVPSSLQDLLRPWPWQPGQCSPPKLLPRLSFNKQRQAFSARPRSGIARTSSSFRLAASNLHFH